MEENSSLSLADHLIASLGEKILLTSPTLITITVLLIFMFLIGLIGNTSVIIVISHHANLRNNSIYFYLYTLAISDLILLVGLPIDLYTAYWHRYPWVFGLIGCKLKGFITAANSYISALTILSVSIEAICYPLKVYTERRLKRALIGIGSIWLISLMCALPYAYDLNIHYLYYPISSKKIVKESALCILSMTFAPLPQAISILFLIIPLLILIVLYLNAAVEIYKYREAEGPTESPKSIIKILAVVVIVYFVCRTPIFFQHLSVFLTIKEYYNEWIYYSYTILYFIPSTVTPLIYAFMSKKYRMAFKKIMCQCQRFDVNTYNEEMALNNVNSPRE